LVKKEPPLGWIIFNQPEKRNAVSQEMWQLMPECVQDLITDKAIRVVILRGAGDRAFVARAAESHHPGQAVAGDDSWLLCWGRGGYCPVDFLHGAHGLRCPGCAAHGVGESGARTTRKVPKRFLRSVARSFRGARPGAASEAAGRAHPGLSACA
jgi:hypothetical protein